MNESNSATECLKTKTLKACRAITHMRGVCRSLNLLQLVSVLCLGVLLFNTYRLYKGSYFWLDDFKKPLLGPAGKFCAHDWTHRQSGFLVLSTYWNDVLLDPLTILRS